MIGHGWGGGGKEIHGKTPMAGIVAIAVAWRFRVTFGTIIVGLAALHFFDWIF